MARTTKEIVEQIATDPFGQGDFYFSESQRQLIAVDQMPLPYARNVMVKLLKEHGSEFQGSKLHIGLYSRLRPTRTQLRQILAADGQASVWAPKDTMVPGDAVRLEQSARARLRGAGRDIHRDVETHRVGDFIEGTCDPVRPNFRVKGKKVSA